MCKIGKSIEAKSRFVVVRNCMRVGWEMGRDPALDTRLFLGMMKMPWD